MDGLIVMGIRFDLTMIRLFEKASYEAKAYCKAVEYVPTDD